MCWCTSTIKDTVGGILDGLVLSLARVLVVLVRFALPTVNTKGTTHICNLVTNNSLTSVTKKMIGSTSLNNVTFESGRELLVFLNTVYVSYFGRSSYKDYSGSRPVENCRYVGVNDITCDIFITSVDI
jgi:hypothetical protein